MQQKLNAGSKTKKANLDDDELRLIKYLFDGSYNKEVRPVRNKSEPVSVIIDLAYTQLVNLVSIC